MQRALRRYRRVVGARSRTATGRQPTRGSRCSRDVGAQLSPTGSYVIFTGWYKMQCCLVQPSMTIADLKQYLHEKNGARMPLECIDLGVRYGDDVKIIDDALTLQAVYERALDGADADFGSGTFVPEDEEEDDDEGAAGGAAVGGGGGRVAASSGGGGGDDDEAMRRAEAEPRRARPSVPRPMRPIPPPRDHEPRPRRVGQRGGAA